MSEIAGAPTRTVKAVVALAPSPSVTVMPTVLDPSCPAAGVMVTVRFAPLPPKTILLVGSNVGLEERCERRRESRGVSESAMTNGMGPDEELAGMLSALMAEMVGGE